MLAENEKKIEQINIPGLSEKEKEVLKYYISTKFAGVRFKRYFPPKKFSPLIKEFKPNNDKN